MPNLRLSRISFREEERVVEGMSRWFSSVSGFQEEQDFGVEEFSHLALTRASEKV